MDRGGVDIAVDQWCLSSPSLALVGHYGDALPKLDAPSREGGHRKRRERAMRVLQGDNLVEASILRRLGDALGVTQVVIGNVIDNAHRLGSPPSRFKPTLHSIAGARLSIRAWRWAVQKLRKHNPPPQDDRPHCVS